MESAYLSVLEEQQNVTNILVEELGVDRWRVFVTNAILPLGHNDHFFFRGDTLFVLSELVQDIMLPYLRQTNTSSCRVACFAQEMAIVRREDLTFGDELGTEWHLSRIKITPSEDAMMLRIASMELLSDEMLLRERIIRRLSRRAGILRMTNGAYTAVWTSMVTLIALLLRPACIELVALKELNFGLEKRVLGPGQTIRRIPPHSQSEECSYGYSSGGIEYEHTPVLRQIENAALELVGKHRPNKVYGDGWLSRELCLSGGEAIERAQAEAQYDKEEDDVEQMLQMMGVYDSEEEEDEWEASMSEDENYSLSNDEDASMDIDEEDDMN